MRCVAALPAAGHIGLPRAQLLQVIPHRQQPGGLCLPEGPADVILGRRKSLFWCAGAGRVTRVLSHIAVMLWLCGCCVVWSDVRARIKRVAQYAGAHVGSKVGLRAALLQGAYSFLRLCSSARHLTQSL